MSPRSAVDKVFREESGAVLASLIRLTGDFERAEEALQEAFVAALENWSSDHLPANPAAWLMTTARRKAIDRLRRDSTMRRKQEEIAALASLEAEEEAERLPDDLLRLIFCCCNPALSPEAQVALTLKSVCSLSTSEIAQSFLVPEATMAQRLVRAKKKIRDARIPFRIPSPEDLPERLGGVLGVIYLLFNEGYFADSHAKLIRGNLCDEALHLARTICHLVPREPECEGLLALLLLQNSRKLARLSAEQELVLLGDQDRNLWDQAAIVEGCQLVAGALERGQIGTYQLQAAIAAVHCEAPTAEETDWPQIVGLYAALRRLRDSPILELNQIVARSMIEGPARALRLLEPLADRLRDYQSYHATRADFLRQTNDLVAAIDAYHAAQKLCDNPALLQFYGRRIEECQAAMG